MYPILLIALSMLCASGFAISARNKKLNKKLKTAVCSVLCAVAAVSSVLLVSHLICKKEPWAKVSAEYTDLGIPYSDYYSDEQKSSRLADDLAVFNGRLYVGGGDYDKNTGPLPIISYDLERGVWESSAELIPDEQIKRFEVINERLVTLGTDPKEDWELGNYYVLENGVWEIFRTLTDGIHCFDAIEFDGDIFFGLGVPSCKSPVICFDGENYSPLDFFKDGERLDTSANEAVRVYNLFEFKGILYAFLSLDFTDENGEKSYFMDLYAYDGKSFTYVNGKLPSADIREIVATDEKIFFIMNETLLSSPDLINFSSVNLGENVIAADITQQNGEIYALATKKLENEKYFNAIFRLSGDGEFKPHVSFKYDLNAGAFCIDGNVFYVSMGSRDSFTDHTLVGRIIKIQANAD